MEHVLVNRSWPSHLDAGAPGRVHDTKLVSSWTLRQQGLTWSGSTLLPADDAIAAVRELREREAEARRVMGSASLAAQLTAHDLVDEYRLMIEPILLGGGKRLFPDDGQAGALELVSTTATATGVLICTYGPAGRWPAPVTQTRLWARPYSLCLRPGHCGR